MTKTPKQYFQLKYSKKVVDFITDKIEEGMPLSKVCDTYGPPNSDIVPNEKNCYRWMKKYPEFKKEINEAYKTLLLRLIDKKMRLAERTQELSELVNDTEDTEENQHAVGEAIRKAKFELDAIKIQQRALEFTLTKIAPKFVEELKETARESSIASLPPITIINYSPPKGKLLEND